VNDGGVDIDHREAGGQAHWGEGGPRQPEQGCHLLRFRVTTGEEVGDGPDPDGGTPLTGVMLDDDPEGDPAVEDQCAGQPAPL
jgi:hypothetical protein